MGERNARVVRDDKKTPLLEERGRENKVAGGRGNHSSCIITIAKNTTPSSILVYHFLQHAWHFCSTWMTSLMHIEKSGS